MQAGNGVCIEVAAISSRRGKKIDSIPRDDAYQNISTASPV